MTDNEIKLIDNMVFIAYQSLHYVPTNHKNDSKNLIKFLNHASDKFGKHGCNDLPEEVYSGWSLDERKKFVYEFHKWNGDPEEYNENFLHLPDFCVFGFLAYKLENEKKLERVSKIKSLYE